MFLEVPPREMSAWSVDSELCIQRPLRDTAILLPSRPHRNTLRSARFWNWPIASNCKICPETKPAGTRQKKCQVLSQHLSFHNLQLCNRMEHNTQGITQLLKVADKKETMAKMNNMKQRESLRVYFFLSRRSNNRRHATKRLQSLSKFRESRNLLLLNTTSVSDCLRLPQLNIITLIRKSRMS